MEPNTFVEAPIQKIYKSNTIRVATFIGGPLAAGYLIGENFKVFDEPEKARKAIIFSVIVTAVIIGASFLLPDLQNGGRYLIPLVYTWAAYYLVQHYQGTNIAAHIDSGGQAYNWWRPIGVSLICLVIMVAAIVGVVYFTGVTDGSDTVKYYGTIKNEVNFDKKNISEAEVTRIADGFTKTGFFDNSIKKYVLVKKMGTSYEISISCNKAVTGNQAAFEFFSKLRTDMQAIFPDHKIVFKLVVDSLDNVVKQIE